MRLFLAVLSTVVGVALGGAWDDGILFVAKQANATLEQLGSDRSHYPNQGTSSNGSLWELASPGAWTCSFFVGTLWRLSNASRHGVGGLDSGMAAWYESQARSLLPALRVEENNTGTHDVGFMMEESFLLGYFLTGDKDMLGVAEQGARSLSTRFDPKLGVFRSWNSAPPTFEVIIDSALNAPLLALAGKESGNESLVEMARSHWHHLLHDGLIRRGGELDGCAYHLQVYNETDGATISLSSTPQGYNQSSLWARGQAWAIHGFTLAYEILGDQEFLQGATDAAHCWMRFIGKEEAKRSEGGGGSGDGVVELETGFGDGKVEMETAFDEGKVVLETALDENVLELETAFDEGVVALETTNTPPSTPLATSFVPPFDFLVPSEWKGLKDTSAATIAASALLRLATLANEPQLEQAAADTLAALLDPSNPFLADPSTSDAALLHGYTAWNPSDPNKPDVSLVYGDMYLLEALLYAETHNVPRNGR